MRSASEKTNANVRNGVTMPDERDEIRIFCEECGKALRPGMAFCPICGKKVDPSLWEDVWFQTPLEAQKPQWCPQCGSKLLPEMRFCPKCAHPLVPERKPKKKNPRHSRKILLYGVLGAVLVGLIALGIWLLLSRRDSQKQALEEAQNQTLELEQMQTWQECDEIAQQYWQQKDYENAIAAWKQALEKEDAPAELHQKLAEGYVTIEDFAQALHEYEVLADGDAACCYAERAQCAVALGEREKAGQILHEAYAATANEAILTLEQSYWDADARHSYGEYIGYDGKYAFGLFDWNHDLTPELMYVYNASDYGNTSGASVELWTYRDGAMQKLYGGSTPEPGVSLTADGSIFLGRPVTNGFRLAEKLDWDGEEITVHRFLDCYLEGTDFTEYELHPEHDYFLENETKARGSFVDNVQVSYEQYEQAREEAANGAEGIPFFPVTRENCKTYLGFDWTEIFPVVAEAYHMEMRPELTVDEVQHVFDPLDLGNGDMIKEPIRYGAYAIVRDDSGEDVLTFAVPFSDNWNKLEDCYAEQKSIGTIANDRVLFQPCFGPACVCCFLLNPADNSIRKLPFGEYSFYGEYLLRYTITFDLYSSKTLELFDSDGNSIAVLLENVSIPSCIIKENAIYLTGIQSGQVFFNGSDNSISPIDIWRFSLETKKKEHMATVIAANVRDVSEDSISYSFSIFDPDSKVYTVRLGAEAEAQAGPALTKNFEPDHTLYPRPERTLKAGMGGEDVKYVQAMLVSLNYELAKVTGGFDEDTESAILSWQKRHGYSETGVIDADVLSKMESDLENWQKKQSYQPDFTFVSEDQNGATQTSDMFAEHKITMLNLWAYWCGPCIQEMPDIQKLHENYAAKGLHVVGVMGGGEEDLTKLKELGITYTNIYLVDGLNEVLNTGYIPATIFVDSEGHILGTTYVGARSYEAWAEIVEDLL